MNARAALVACLLITCLAACDRIGGSGAERAVDGPKLDAPTLESEPARVFMPASESARVIVGRLTLTLTTRMPGPDGAGGGEVLSLRTQTGLSAEAVLSGAIAPSTAVEGQTIRALMELPVEASQVIVYEVTESANAGGARGLCGEREMTRLVLWEPDAPGASDLRLLAVAGEAPGRPGALLCSAYTFTRAE